MEPSRLDARIGGDEDASRVQRGKIDRRTGDPAIDIHHDAVENMGVIGHRRSPILDADKTAAASAATASDCAGIRCAATAATAA